MLSILKLTRIGEVQFGCNLLLPKSLHQSDQQLMTVTPMDALHRSLSQGNQIGSLAVVVDAKDDQARLFYRRYDFIQFSDEPSKFFLPMGSIEKLF
ncbi:MAG TPA: hypothetical protein VMW38_03105 [Terriglobia bacterium]|nr:hypothetical protein [Terriglobia bacterium]